MPADGQLYMLLEQSLRVKIRVRVYQTCQRMASYTCCLNRAFEYPCSWGGVVDGKPVVDALDDFGTRVLNNLWNSICKYFPDQEAMLDEFTHESGQQQAFLEHQRQQFVGRQKLLKECMQVLRDPESSLVMLAGKAGTGKSALMSAVVQQYSTCRHCVSAQSVLVHAVGATPSSTNVAALLRRLCHELVSRFNLDTDLPTEYKNLVGKFAELLKEAGGQCSSPLMVFIDGVNGMDATHHAHMMHWLPEIIPKNVVLVASTVEGSDSYKSLVALKPTVVKVGPLELLDKALVARKMLSVHHKQLDESAFNNQMKLLVTKKEATVPLFLSLACEELRVFGVYEKLTSKLKSLPHTVPLLLQEMMSRLEEDHGSHLVATALSLLVCSRNGLSEGELLELLSYSQSLQERRLTASDLTNIAMSSGHLLAQAVYVPMLTALKGFLRPASSSDAILSLAHSEISRAIHHRYIKSASAGQEMMLHTLLAAYYRHLVDPSHDLTWTGKNAQAFSELPYHLACSGQYKELEEVLCDLRFIHAKCRLGLAIQLLEDFQAQGLSTRAAEREQSKFVACPRVHDYQAFVSRNSHILKSHPTLTWQQAANEPDSSRPTRDVKLLLGDQKVELSMMEWLNKPSAHDPCIYTLASLPQVVTCVSVSHGSQHLACGDKDCVARIYDLDTGKEVKSFTGHANEITDVCYVGVDRLCTASADNSLSLWNINDGHRVAVMKGHKRRVNSCASNAAGKALVSAGWDCCVKLWNASSGKFEGELKEPRPVNCVTFHPEGQLVVTGNWDSAIRIWDTFHKARKGVLRGHLTSVRDVAFSPSGRHIASAALDGEVKIWSALNGCQVGNLSGHALPINKLCFSKSGLELVTASDDHKVKVWSGHLGQPVSRMGDKDHGAVSAVAIHPSGEQLAAGYHEGYIRIFHLISGLMEVERKAHRASVRAIKYSKDGLRILTGSDDCSALVHSEAGEHLYAFTGHTKPLMGVAYGRYLVATASQDFTVNLYQESTHTKPGAIIKPQYTLTGHSGPVSCISFNSDETKLVTGSRDMSLRIWDVRKLNPGTNCVPLSILDACHSDWINSCAWSDTGDFIVSASNDFNLKLWDVKTGKEKVKFTGHMSAINSVAYSYGCIVSGCYDGSVKVWSHKGTEITTLHGHAERVNSCDILVKIKVKQGGSASEESATSDWATMAEQEEWAEQHDKTKLEKKDVIIDEVLVATCSDDGFIRTWQPLQGNELANLTGHADRVIATDCTSNRQVCSSSLDRSVKVWNMTAADSSLSANVHPEVANTHVHNAPVSAVGASHAGQFVVSASRDGRLKVWSVSAGDASHGGRGSMVCMYTVKGHEKAVNSVSFHASQENIFVTASDDCSAKVWRIVSTSKGLMLRIDSSVKKPSPITCAQWTNIVPCHSDQFVTTEWNQTLSVIRWDSSYGKSGRCTSHTSTQGHGDWVMCCTAFNSHGRSGLLTGGADEKLIRWQLDIGKQGMISQLKMVKTSLIGYQGNKHLSSERQEPNWVTCVVTFDDLVFAGDVHGQVSKQRSTGDLVTKKVHSDIVTACTVSNMLLFTASRDLTIKVWDFQLTQMGQFFCQAPVTALTLIPWMESDGISMVTMNKMLGNDCHLMCGDELGNVAFLHWRP